MKDHQRSVQENRVGRTEQKRGQQAPAQARVAQLPARQWIGLLRQADGMLELPESVLEQLAQAVGNSTMVDLLRRGTGGEPAARMPEVLFWESPQTEVNCIRTEPPELLPFEGWPEKDGAWPRPAGPGRVRDRG